MRRFSASESGLQLSASGSHDRQKHTSLHSVTRRIELLSAVRLQRCFARDVRVGSLPFRAHCATSKMSQHCRDSNIITGTFPGHATSYVSETLIQDIQISDHTFAPPLSTDDLSDHTCPHGQRRHPHIDAPANASFRHPDDASSGPKEKHFQTITSGAEKEAWLSRTTAVQDRTEDLDPEDVEGKEYFEPLSPETSLGMRRPLIRRTLTAGVGGRTCIKRGVRRLDDGSRNPTPECTPT